jgi:hypothetical protein
MTILVCGGRDYKNKQKVFKALDLFFPHECEEEPLSIIEGGATGADELARLWAESNNIEYHHCPADWEKHGKSAGPIRNQEMLDTYKPDIVLAFKGGRGTQNMIDKAMKKGIIVLKVGE